MSAVTKNLHVHFDDDLPAASKTEARITMLDQNENTATIFKYSRDELLELKKNSTKESSKFLSDIQAADEKRKEKIKCVFRKEKYMKLFNNPSKFVTKPLSHPSARSSCFIDSKAIAIAKHCNISRKIKMGCFWLKKYRSPRFIRFFSCFVLIFNHPPETMHHFITSLVFARKWNMHTHTNTNILLGICTSGDSSSDTLERYSYVGW